MRIDWPRVRRNLDDRGFARVPGLLGPPLCLEVRALFDRDELFRSTIDMGPRRYGSGRYRYFAAPLPSVVARLRTRLYAPLAHTARSWALRLGEDPRAFPGRFAQFRARCEAQGQRRPTPLLLRYGPGDWNALHQDSYGAIAFPLQVVIALSERDREYTGGEIVLHERRPRAQSRAHVITLEQGEGLVFTNRERPARGSRGDYRVAVSHGVSEIRSGERVALGIIFHDAR